ncbi:MAG: hypothetical protein JNK94_07420 [Hyphomonadaceae bacterium]|nr:hypothetical protein [Hyphomonadaceae bacterium]
MTDIAFICVREDVAEAEALADILDAAGYAVTAENNDAALLASTVQLVIWSRAALRSRAFVAAAERAINADAAVVACLDDPVATDLEGTPCFDLRAWDGAPEAAVLDPLLATLDQRTMDARAAGRDAGVLHLSLRPPGAEGVLARGGGDVGYAYASAPGAMRGFDSHWAAAVPEAPFSAPPEPEPPPAPALASVRAPRPRRGRPIAAFAAVFVAAALFTGFSFAPRPAARAIIPEAPATASVSFAQAATPSGPPAIATPAMPDVAPPAPWGHAGREPASAPRIRESTPQPWRSWDAAESPMRAAVHDPAPSDPTSALVPIAAEAPAPQKPKPRHA